MTVFRLLPVCWATLVGAFGLAVASSGGAAELSVPRGFVVEKVAGSPLVEHPLMACFDERGRLFVAESAGLNLPAAELLEKKPNSIRLLEDTDGDGRFDRSQVFADQMTFPQGALWHQGALYVCSPPNLWKLEDTDGDGKCDRRTEVVGQFGFNGNAADIHGPFLGPEGWLYWCDGRHGHDIEQPDGTKTQGQAARIFRCRADGSGLETVCGGGMDNPTELAFTAAGEPLATVNILLSRPQRVDGLIYAIEGGVYPHDECYREFRRTGELLPAVGPLGWVAVSGITRYQHQAFGEDFRDNFFTAQFNPHRVQRHLVEREGAAFRVRHEDFLTSTDHDFHPTDVLEDADGSLLVIDTGGWFRIGCPTSQIAKPEVAGAIYRVRRADADAAKDPRGVQIAWDKLDGEALAKLLDDPRSAVRERAIAVAGARGEALVAALRASLAPTDSKQRRLNAVWALCRSAAPAAREAVRDALTDEDRDVRLAAIHAVGMHRDPAAADALIGLLGNQEASVRRSAAISLGRIKAKQAVAPLLVSAALAGDPFAHHAVVYALQAIGDAKATAAGLADIDPRAKRAALIALTGMAGAELSPMQVTPLLSAEYEPLRQEALLLLAAKPEWAEDSARALEQELRKPAWTAAQQQGVQASLSALATTPAVERLIGRLLVDESLPAEAQRLVLAAAAKAEIDRLPSAWLPGVQRALAGGDELASEALAVVQRTRSAECDELVLAIATDEQRMPGSRLTAWQIAGPRHGELDDRDYAFLAGCLSVDEPAVLRLPAARVLASVQLTPAQRLKLADCVRTAGPLELPELLAAFALPQFSSAASPVVAALVMNPAADGLPQELLDRLWKVFPSDAQSAAAPLLARRARTAEAREARLVELEPQLAQGNSGRGQGVFYGAKAACSTCHTVAGQGGAVGPDLSRIATIRNGRDLLEAVVFPSASIVRGFEPLVAATEDGRLVTGLLVHDTTDTVVLRQADGSDVPLAKRSLEELRPSATSIMPQGLETTLTPEELADLLAYLQTLGKP